MTGRSRYRQLERLTNQAANGLKALGVKKGDRVTLFAQNSAEWVLSYIGIAKAGGVINPVNAMLTADELAYVVKDCGAKVLITTSERAKAVLHLKKDGSLKEIVVLSGAPLDGHDFVRRSAWRDRPTRSSRPATLPKSCRRSATPPARPDFPRARC